jgi:hypothetical protein
MKRVSTILLACFLWVTLSFSQNDCAINLQKAQADFDKGRVELVAGSINSCLESKGFSREDEITAYKLLIQALLLDEKTGLAEQTMLEFLKKNPEYLSTAADYTGFVYLKNKYQIKPVLMVSARVGLSHTFLSGKSESSLSSLDPQISYAREPLNITAGVELLKPVANRLRIGLGLSYCSASFLYNENMMNFGTVSYRESQSRLEIPVSAVYDFTQQSRVVLYGRLGAGVAINLSTDSKSSFSPSDLNNGFIRTGENVSRSPSRVKSELFLQAGFGGAIKIPHGYFTAEIRSQFGTRNQPIRANPENLEYYYFYTDDSFRLNMATITLGYTYIFYRPSKIQDL